MSSQQRDIKYLNRNFDDFKQALQDYAKTYFPNTFNDFTDSDPGTMFMEMVSYVGDVLSFYQDNQLQEAFIKYAQQKENLLALAYQFGYTPKVTATSNVKLDVYQILPAITGLAEPDLSYALVIDKGAIVQSVSNPSVSFVTDSIVNFSFSSSYDPTTINVYQIDPNTNLPEYYIMKKSVNAIAGSIKNISFDFGSPVKYSVVDINDDNIIQILNAVDSDGNTWYEVPYLAQATIFNAVPNNNLNDPNFAQFSDTVPYMLDLKKVPRRFVTRFRSDNTMEIEFGPGTLSIPDEEIIPNPDNIGMGIINGLSKMNLAYDPSNFLYTKDYGQAPANTTITFNYLIGGGITSNVPANDITNITSLNLNPATFNTNLLNPNLLDLIKQSVAFNNVTSSQGGGDGDSIQDLRNNTQAAFATQLRCVTADDYVVRSLSLPPQFGSISKVYVTQDQLLNSQVNPNDFINSNPLALSMYVLGYDSNGKIIQTNYALKENLKRYISQFRLKTDAITIKNAFYINLKVLFDIVVLPGFNPKEVLSLCVTALADYFNIKSWQINQPIVISNLNLILAQIKGVETVKNISFENIVDNTGINYSPYSYDIIGATKSGVVYPSRDPMIFEIRYPDNDIYGKIVTL
jgi:hypothetical protein